MKPLPTPERGGSVEKLRSFLNVQSDDDLVLVVAWVLACLRDRGPYPVLAVAGEQGLAKSTFMAILRALLDPNTAPLRALPREDRDLFIAASNGHVLAFDNVSGLPTWISDTLCRLATGGGFAVRQLEVLFDAARPVILNGIGDVVTRPDLADRSIFLTPEPIPEERRRPEQELLAAFEAERRASWARCLMLWRRGWKCSRRPSWKRCRAWLTSLHGRRRASLRSGQPELSCRPIAQTLRPRGRMYSKPMRLRLL
jgi:hypothetical protein